MHTEKRKKILYLATSLDWYIASRDWWVDRLFEDQDYGYWAFIWSVDTVVMGRKTYDQIKTLADDWPYAAQQSYIYSHEIASEDRSVHDSIQFVAHPVNHLKEVEKEDGKNIWVVWWWEIASLFLAQWCVDELIVTVHPLLLGWWIPLYEHADVCYLDLQDVETYDSWIVQMRYRIDR